MLLAFGLSQSKYIKIQVNAFCVISIFIIEQINYIKQKQRCEMSF